MLLLFATTVWKKRRRNEGESVEIEFAVEQACKSDMTQQSESQNESEQLTQFDDYLVSFVSERQ